jgi:DNA-directed RNA polymerase specialized sigma24 family protein
MNLPNELLRISELFAAETSCVRPYWLFYANQLLSSYHINHLYNGEDILDNIFLDIYTGKKEWDPICYTDIRLFVQLLIHTTIRNFADHEKHNVKLDTVEQFLTEDHTIDIVMEHTITDHCLKELEDDETTSFVFLDAYEDMRNREITKDLGISVREVENAKKRMRRKLEKSVRALVGDDWVRDKRIAVEDLRPKA